jgi:hypothetical protein
MNENEMNKKLLEMIKEIMAFDKSLSEGRALRNIYDWAKNNEDEEFVNYVGNMLDDYLSAQG